jgi:predicted PurR-regulated permease PerM
MRQRKAAAKDAQFVPTEDPVVPSKQNKVFFVSALLGVLFLSALLFRPFFTSIVTGLLLAYFSYPIFRFVRTFLRLRALSGVVSLLIVLGLFVFPFIYLGVAFIDDARDFAADFVEGDPPAIVVQAFEFYAATRVEDPQNQTQVEAEMEAILEDLVAQGSQFVIGAIPNLIGLIINLLIGLLIVSFVMFYFYVDREDMGAYITKTMPLPPHQTRFLLLETRHAINAIFIGQLAGALLQGLVGGIGFWLFGVPYPVFWGAIMGVLSLLPVVGAFLVWAPAGIIMIVTGDVVNGVLLLLWGAVLVSNVDNVVKPILIGGRTGIHPLLVLIGVFGGIALFGIIGFIVGPLLLGVAAAFLKVWNSEYHDRTGWVLVKPAEGVQPPPRPPRSPIPPSSGPPR